MTSDVTLQWNELDSRAVTTAKILAADAVENAGSGHPGTAISLAAAAYLLFQRHIRFDPHDDLWPGRDKFVLSAGHASLTQYIQLYLAGAGLDLDDLKGFRQFGSATPGHPEYRHTKGIEITTGPLGSGLASAIGLAMSQRRLRGLMDPDAPEGESPFDHTIYVIAGDGCLQEGLASEACSLAGTQELGNVVLIYDDNDISIEDDTDISFTEDVLQRFEAYGWHTQEVDWTHGGTHYSEDVQALDDAINAAKAEHTKPSIISLKTIIGWPSPTKQNTGGIHGAKLGSEELAGLKRVLGADVDAMFDVDQEAVNHARDNAAQRGKAAREAWDSLYQTWRENHPEQAELHDRMFSHTLPDGLEDALPSFEPGASIATRSASGQVINALAPMLPELWGGSADLAGSNNTPIKEAPSFIPSHRSTKEWKGNPYGRNLHFGVREHAMGAIANGIALDGFSRIYVGTFFVFADYMRGAVRLASLMNLPVTYVWTHDSIGVGEDGPTHQPVEHLAAYRAIPHLSIVRPADAEETAVAWLETLKQQSPVGLILTRQNVPNPKRGDGEASPDGTLASASHLARGGYVLRDCEATPDVILMASGSEVQYCLEAADILAAEGRQVRVVSMPCMEWFEAQDDDYKESVLPREVHARVSVEAGLALPWLPYVGPHGVSIAMDSFGLPGSGAELFEHFGFTTDNVVAKAREVMNS